MVSEREDESSWFFRLLTVGLALGFGVFLLFRSPPPDPPANGEVFGCYSASEAPDILLDEAGMHVRQGGFSSIGFHLERHKTGIALVAEAPIRADFTAEGYQFAINRSGIGLFLPLFREQDGRTYGMFDQRLLEGFQMLASDGAWLNYRRADAAKCVAA